MMRTTTGACSGSVLRPFRGTWVRVRVVVAGTVRRRHFGGGEDFSGTGTGVSGEYVQLIGGQGPVPMEHAI